MTGLSLSRASMTWSSWVEVARILSPKDRVLVTMSLCSIVPRISRSPASRSKSTIWTPFMYR